MSESGIVSFSFPSFLRLACVGGAQGPWTEKIQPSFCRACIHILTSKRAQTSCIDKGAHRVSVLNTVLRHHSIILTALLYLKIFMSVVGMYRLSGCLGGWGFFGTGRRGENTPENVLLGGHRGWMHFSRRYRLFQVLEPKTDWCSSSRSCPSWNRHVLIALFFFNHFVFCIFAVEERRKSGRNFGGASPKFRHYQEVLPPFLLQGSEKR